MIEFHDEMPCVQRVFSVFAAATRPRCLEVRLSRRWHDFGTTVPHRISCEMAARSGDRYVARPWLRKAFARHRRTRRRRTMHDAWSLDAAGLISTYANRPGLVEWARRSK